MGYYSGEELTIAVVSSIAIAIFVFGLYIQFRKYGVGIAGRTSKVGAIGFVRLILSLILKNIKKDPKRFVKLFVFGILFQRMIFRRSKFRWVMHLMIFWGWILPFIFFMIIVFFWMVDWIYGHMYGVEPSIYLTPNFWIEEFETPANIAEYMLLGGISVAVVRRIISKAVREMSDFHDYFLTFSLFFVVIVGLISELMGKGVFGELSNYAPQFTLFYEITALLIFVAFVPFTKYFHMIAVPLVILALGDDRDV